MTEPADLFPRSEDAGQLSLFGPEAGKMQPPVQPVIPDPEVVRRRLHTLLVRAREAEVMPWPERDARMWQTVFPQMANWLPDEEADQLRFEFIREIERLKAAA